MQKNETLKRFIREISISITKCREIGKLNPASGETNAEDEKLRSGKLSELRNGFSKLTMGFIHVILTFWYKKKASIEASFLFKIVQVS